MKRFATLLIILLIIGLAAIYLLIPSTLKIAAVNVVPTNSEAVFRLISSTKNWNVWANNNTNQNENEGSFLYKADTFLLKEILHNAARIRISGKSSETNSLFTILPITKDSTILRWETEVATGNNPILKLKHYQQAVSIKNNITAIMNNMQHFLEKQENVYGFAFNVASTNDTLLVATRSVHTTYPESAVLYKTIEQLKQYVVDKGAEQTSAPLMNVSKTDDNKFQLMVALPVNKIIKADAPYINRQLVKGNFLIAEVKGGVNTVDSALHMMQLYISDLGKTAMAIPFQRLITDRQKQPDSTKWITRIYFPVIR